MKPKIIAVVGHTASGKTELAIRLAERLGGEIVCCDSMQIYRVMNIGTAKPTPEEQARVPHHLFDFIDPHRSYSCADYCTDAEEAIADILSRGKLPIVCGGTGLYLDSLLFERPFFESSGKSEIRERLAREAEELGAHAIYERLREVDPESAEKIHENNLRRLIRALEIYYSCGVPKSVLDRESKKVESRYDASVVALHYSNRDLLYSRIERRVDAMIDEGLLYETEALLREGVFEKNGTAAQAIGYKELLGYIRGECELSDAVAQLKTATRRYAKRQITWFGAKDYVSFIDVTDGESVKRFEEIVNIAEKLFSL